MAMVARGNRAVALLLLVALAVCALLRPCSSTSLRGEEQSGKKPTTAARWDTAEEAEAAAAAGGGGGGGAETTTIVLHGGMLLEQRRDYEQQRGRERNLEDLEPQLSISEADGVELSVLPSVEESTILFLHVFKCAGTSLRQVFLEWAKSEGWTGAIVIECRDIREANGRRTMAARAHHKRLRVAAGGARMRTKAPDLERRICLNSQNDIKDMAKEKWLVRGQKALVGHFFWDFRNYVQEPYLMITTLRNPLELFVSALQFKNREQTRTLSGAVQLATESMQTSLSRKDPNEIGFVRRFLDQDAANDYRTYRTYAPEEYAAMVSSAVDHLNTFWVVGVVEQYEGFLEVLEAVLDPFSTNAPLWRKAHLVASNGSPVHSSDVLANVEPEVARQFNSSVLGPQWQFYEVALDLWDSRCREVLPVENHDRFCSVKHH